MLSVRAAFGIALLVVAMTLSASELAAQSRGRAPYKRATQEQSQIFSQAPISAGQVEVIDGSSRWIEELGTQQPATGPSGKAKSVPAVDKVDVINGASRSSQVFNMEKAQKVRSGQPGRKVSKGRAQKQVETESLPNVEIINGARFETRSFAGVEAEPPLPERLQLRRQRVVVGVETAESARRRGIATPVVTGVATPESERERANKSPVVVAIASSEARSDANTLPGQYWVTPQAPKRPPYHPDPPKSQ